MAEKTTKQTTSSQNVLQNTKVIAVEQKFSKEYLEEKKILMEYIEETVKHGPTQKSAAWYAIKNVTIGGSEVATVLGLNKFKSVSELVAEKSKCRQDSFSGSIATRWGNIFEPVTKLWTELVLNMPERIMEFGSVEGIIMRQRYSPDGIGLVLLKDTEGNLTWFKVLFEFKAPFSRLPEGIVPEHYYPQVQTGLLTFPFLDMSIFVNNCYRKCKLSELGFGSEYDKTFHNDAKMLEKANVTFETLACGMIFFYQRYADYIKLTNKEDPDEPDVDLEESFFQTAEEVEKYNEKFNKINLEKLQLIADTDPDKKAIDFGTSNNKMLANLFELVEEGQIYCHYSSIFINNEKVAQLPLIKFHDCKIPQQNKKTPKAHLINEFNEFLEICDQQKNKIIGYLPWKLMKSDMIIQNLEDGWQEKIEPKIKEVLQQIDEIVALPTEEARRKKLDEFYPPKIQKPTIDLSLALSCIDDDDI